MSRAHARGFTLIEVVVTTAVAAVVIGAAFAFAHFQVRSYATQSDVTRMQNGARIVFEAVARDIRNAGFGTSFYAGAGIEAFGGILPVPDPNDGSSLGLPALRMVNNASDDSDPNGVMPGTDAISLLRIESESTSLPASGPGAVGIPAVPQVGVEYPVVNAAVLQTCKRGPYLVLISDVAHQDEPASMILPLMDVDVNRNTIKFADNYGINPANAARTSNRSVPPQGVGPGSVVVCARPVTYWVDKRARLRIWEATPANSAPGVLKAISGAVFGQVPYAPNSDPVLIEGLENLQIALYMSNEAAQPEVRNNWAFDGPDRQLDIIQRMVETRAVRLDALLRTARKEDSSLASARPPVMEDGHIPDLAQIGCTDLTACYDPRYHRKPVQFQADVRNLRIYDLLSSTSRTSDMIRSYPE